MDDAYANAAYIPDAARYLERWPRAAAAFRDQLVSQGRAQLDIPYGVGARQAFDMFHPQATPEGTFIFVHGGYWNKFSRKDWSHFAEGALEAGWSVAMPSYDLCPDVPVQEITEQVRDAVTMIAGQSAGPLILAGHSAGGHLVARMLAPGMLGPEILARIRHVLPISPVSDLRPLLPTSMNATLGLDEVSARAESPALSPRPAIPVTIWVGADERPAFLDQARWLAEAWGCAQETLAGRHHFDVIDLLRARTEPLGHVL